MRLATSRLAVALRKRTTGQKGESPGWGISHTARGICPSQGATGAVS